MPIAESSVTILKLIVSLVVIMSSNVSFSGDAVRKAFKAYDVRGKIPEELSSEIVQFIGNAFVSFLKLSSGSLVVGYDVRPTSFDFSKALIKGITDHGLDVIDIGLCGTDMVYYATAALNAAGGVMITASHNPANYNGLKFVRENAIPISGDTGLLDICDLVVAKNYVKKDKKGTIAERSVLPHYIDHILKFVDVRKIPSLKVVMNAGNGCAGVVLPELVKRLPSLKVVPVFWQPDGSFPNGIPNPLLSERREDTRKQVLEEKADLGVAWDGDFDRCFFYDNEGNFIEGYYLVPLFGEFFAKRKPGSKIIHDPRLIWATIDVIKTAGGVPVETKAGHAFIKERMRQEDAIYAGEMSAHHYFKDNFYADNGMIPMLLLLQILGETGKSLRELVNGWMAKYPVSGEINITVANADKVISKLKESYAKNAVSIDEVDGVSINYEKWRFNIRKSNTEPVIRLNVESRNDSKLMEQKRDEILSFIKQA